MRSTLVRAVVLTALVSSLAACKEQPAPPAAAAPTPEFTDLTGIQILAAAKKAMKNVSSLHVQESLVHAQDGYVGVDLDVTKRGDCAGSVAYEHTRAELLVIDGEAWLKGDKAFWGQFPEGDAVFRLVGDKWAKVPTGRLDEDLCNLKQMMKQLNLGEKKLVSIGAMKDIDGVAAVEVIRGLSTSIWISVAEPHYVVTYHDAEQYSLDFTEINVDFDIKPPPKKQVVDLTGARPA